MSSQRPHSWTLFLPFFPGAPLTFLLPTSLALVSCCSVHPRTYPSHCPPQFLPLPSWVPFTPHSTHYPCYPFRALCLLPLEVPSSSLCPPSPNVLCPFPGTYPVSSHLPSIFQVDYILDLFSPGPATVPGGGAGIETQPVTVLALGKDNHQLCAACCPPGARSCLEGPVCGCVGQYVHGSGMALTLDVAQCAPGWWE